MLIHLLFLNVIKNLNPTKIKQKVFSISIIINFFVLFCFLITFLIQLYVPFHSSKYIIKKKITFGINLLYKRYLFNSTTFMF